MRIIGIVLALTLTTTFAYTHPGRTALDGCHFCRTNCDSWGVPWNQRHCHYKAEPKDLEEGLLRFYQHCATMSLALNIPAQRVHRIIIAPTNR